MSVVDMNRARGASAQGRALDIALALASLVVFAPVMLAVSLAILVETGRPILFVQVRLGRGGRRFRMYKFRKFGPGPDTQGCPLTVRGDPRMTRVGRILEASKLDELPQLFNILRGDMAFVGPRPESLAFEDCFAGPFRAVLDNRPGIFGPSQVAFRSEGRLYPADADPAEFYRRVLFPTKASLDLAYFRRRTVLGDIGWLLRGTLAVVGGASGAVPPLADVCSAAAPPPGPSRAAPHGRAARAGRRATSNMKSIAGR